MQNLSVTWSYKSFKSKEETREYCLSKECSEYISYLYTLSDSLLEQSIKEIPICPGHGYPLEAPSSLEASYVSAEANRLNELRKYFMGDPAKLGFKWVYDLDRHTVRQEVELGNWGKNHPVFLEYMKNQNLTEKDTDEAYNIWIKFYDGSENGINALFKAAYYFKMKNLIPDNIQSILVSSSKKSKVRRRK